MSSPRRFNTIFRVLCFLFVIYSNSSYAQVGKTASFYCSDTSLKKPFSGDSISAKLLFLTLLGGSSIVIYISEMFCGKKTTEGNGSFKGSPTKNTIKYYYSGFLYVLAVTEILKFNTVELRPHFFETCQPNVDHVRCSEGLITNFNCTGTGPSWLVDRDIYKSFPSGHASLSFYTFIFITMYMHRRSKYMKNTLLLLWKVSIPMFFLTWASVCSITRLLDYRHFWWDVLVGIFIGLLGGLITGKWIYKEFCISEKVHEK